MRADPLIPSIGVVTAIRVDTPDVKTFRVNAPGGGKLFATFFLIHTAYCNVQFPVFFRCVFLRA